MAFPRATRTHYTGSSLAHSPYREVQPPKQAQVQSARYPITLPTILWVALTNAADHRRLTTDQLISAWLQQGVRDDHIDPTKVIVPPLPPSPTVEGARPNCEYCGLPVGVGAKGMWKRTCGKQECRSAAISRSRQSSTRDPAGCPVLDMEGTRCGDKTFHNGKYCKEHRAMVQDTQK